MNPVSLTKIAISVAAVVLVAIVGCGKSSSSDSAAAGTRYSFTSPASERTENLKFCFSQ